VAVFDELVMKVGIEADKYTSGLRRMQSATQQFENTIKKLATTLAAVFGTAGLVAMMKKNIELWAKAEEASLQLAYAVNTFTKSGIKLYDTISKLGSELQQTLGVGDDYVKQLAAIGLSMGITEDKIVKATKASVLLSRVLGVDAQTLMKGFAQTLQGTVGLLGRYIPEVSSMTKEQLQAGEAIELVSEKFSELEDVLSGTTRSALDRLKESIGDVGEVMGEKLQPFVMRAADAIASFSQEVAEKGSVIEVVKEKFMKFYESLPTLGKGIVTFAGAFLALKVGAVAFHLLASAIVSGGSIIVNVFKTIFSWPALLIASIYLLRVAWKHNWFGIRDWTLETWEAIKKAWKGGYQTYEEIWKDPNLDLVQKFFATVVKVVHDGIEMIKEIFSEIKLVSERVWSDSYKSFADIWADPELGFLAKTVGTIEKIFKDAIDGIVIGWRDSYASFAELWQDPNLSFLEKTVASIVKVFKDLWDGLKAGWIESFSSFKEIWGSPDLNFLEKVGATIGAILNKIWQGGEGYKGLGTIWGEAWKAFKKVWSDPDLSFLEKLKETFSITMEAILQSVQSVGAALTEFFGGDPQKYIEETTNAIEQFKRSILEFGKAETLFERFSKMFEIGKTLYELPAKFVVSGFELDRNTQEWIDNALNMLAVIGITKFVGGSWRMAVAFGLLADFLFGDEWTGNKWMNELIRAAEAVGFSLIITKGNLALAIPITFTLLSLKGFEDRQKVLYAYKAYMDYAQLGIETTLRQWAMSELPSVLWTLPAQQLAEIAERTFQEGFSSLSLLDQGMVLAESLILGFEYEIRKRFRSLKQLFEDSLRSLFVSEVDRTVVLDALQAHMQYVYAGNEQALREWAKQNLPASLWTLSAETLASMAEETFTKAFEKLSLFDKGVVLGETLIMGLYNTIVGAGGKILEALKKMFGSFTIRIMPVAGFGAMPLPVPSHQKGGYTQGADREIAGIVHGGEWVAPAWMVRHPVYGRLIALLEVARMRGYQFGGYVGESGGRIPVTFENLFGRPQETLKAMFEDLVETMKSDWKALMEFGKELLQELGGALGIKIDQLESVMDRVVKQFDEQEKEIERWKKEFGDSSAETTSALDELKKALAESSELFEIEDGEFKPSVLGQGIVELFKGSFTKAFSLIGTGIVPILTKFLFGLESVTKILNPFTTILEGLFGLIGPVLDTIFKPFAEMLRTIGKFLGIFILPVLQILKVVLKPLAWAFAYVGYAIDQVILWINKLPLIGGFLTREQIQQMRLTPAERMREWGYEEAETEQETSVYGQTFTAGTPQYITNNFNVTFSENVLLQEDDEALRHLAELFVRYVKEHGGVKVVFGE